MSETEKNNIIANNGSIQQIQIIPPHIKEKYKIVWEIPMKHVIDMAWTDKVAFEGNLDGHKKSSLFSELFLLHIILIIPSISGIKDPLAFLHP